MFEPIFEQLKVDLSIEKVTPQASFEPLSISLGEIDALPSLSNFIVLFLVITTGAILSSIVTIASAVAKFPFLSVTFRITLFEPIFEQLKVDLSIEKVASQKLLEPLSIS